MRPCVDIEGIYEGESDYTQSCLQSEASWLLLGGVMGQFCGSGAIRVFPSGWEEGLDSRGIESILQFRQLQYTRPWRQFEPDQDHRTLLDGYGDHDTRGYEAGALAIGGRGGVVYLLSSCTVTIVMDRISGSAAAAWWFDPITGTAKQIGRLAASGTRAFTPPKSHDWALVIDDSSPTVRDRSLRSDAN